MTHRKKPVLEKKTPEYPRFDSHLLNRRKFMTMVTAGTASAALLGCGDDCHDIIPGRTAGVPRQPDKPQNLETSPLPDGELPKEGLEPSSVKDKVQGHWEGRPVSGEKRAIMGNTRAPQPPALDAPAKPNPVSPIDSVRNSVEEKMPIQQGRTMGKIKVPTHPKKLAGAPPYPAHLKNDSKKL